MGVAEEPILTRLDRVDKMVRKVEEMKGSGRWSPSSPSTTGTTSTSEGQRSLDVSPRSMEKHCRPMHSVMVETELKGTLLHRLDHLEHRLLKLEEELQAERKAAEEEKPKKQKGLKKLVNKVVRGGSKHHTPNHLL